MQGLNAQNYHAQGQIKSPVSRLKPILVQRM